MELGVVLAWVEEAAGQCMFDAVLDIGKAERCDRGSRMDCELASCCMD
jgi:hypothetical protein